MVAADKLANARTVIADLPQGDGLWKRFKGGQGGTVWYYVSMSAALDKGLPGSRNVAELAGHARTLEAEMNAAREGFDGLDARIEELKLAAACDRYVEIVPAKEAKKDQEILEELVAVKFKAGAIYQKYYHFKPAAERFGELSTALRKVSADQSTSLDAAASATGLTVRRANGVTRSGLLPAASSALAISVVFSGGQRASRAPAAKYTGIFTLSAYIKGITELRFSSVSPSARLR